MLNLMSFSPSNFGRYVSQSDYNMDESTDMPDRSQIQQKPPMNHIPALMSLNITPPPNMTANIQQTPIIPPSVIKENIEPLPFPQSTPGPIQRPTRLLCLSNTQTSSFVQDPSQSPSTPDVLIQINRLVDRQNSIATIPAYASNLNSSATSINDPPTPNIPWTPFAPPESTAKYDSTWPLTNIPSLNSSLATHTENPFTRRHVPKEEQTLWSDASVNNPWFKFSTVSDSNASNTQGNDTNDPFWNPLNMPRTQSNTSTPWWPKTPSDENNNDQSRWEFAR